MPSYSSHAATKAEAEALCVQLQKWTKVMTQVKLHSHECMHVVFLYINNSAL